MNGPGDMGWKIAWRCCVVGALLTLAACAGAGPERSNTAPLGADFGNAVSHNAAQHVLDPAPRNLTSEPPPMDGARAGAAIRRYRGGTVVEPEKVDTSAFGELR